MESLDEWIERLKAVSQKKGTVVVVEGKKDKHKLEKFGIRNIYQIKGKRFYDILEDLENSSYVVMLTDLDKQGEKIFSRLKFILEREGIPVDRFFRQELKKFGIKHIEDIPIRRGDVSKTDNTLS
ncbi:toprim domain-containing protein [Persephonella sp.]